LGFLLDVCKVEVQTGFKFELECQIWRRNEKKMKTALPRLG
jgi:hypothetical protein